MSRANPLVRSWAYYSWPSPPSPAPSTAAAAAAAPVDAICAPRSTVWAFVDVLTSRSWSLTLCVSSMHVRPRAGLLGVLHSSKHKQYQSLVTQLRGASKPRGNEYGYSTDTTYMSLLVGRSPSFIGPYPFLWPTISSISAKQNFILFSKISPLLPFVSWIPQSSSVRYQHLGSAWAAIRSNTPPEVRTWHYLLYRACRKQGSVCSGPSRRLGLMSCLLFSALHMWLALRPRVSLCPFPPRLLIRQSILGGTCLSPCAWWGRCGYSMYCTKPNRLVSREPKT